MGLSYPFRHPVFTTAQGALADGAASLSVYLRSLARKSGGDAHDASIRGDDPTVQAPADQAPSPPEPVLVGLIGSLKQPPRENLWALSPRLWFDFCICC